jgi:hypothetical protein
MHKNLRRTSATIIRRLSITLLVDEFPMRCTFYHTHTKLITSTGCLHLVSTESAAHTASRPACCKNDKYQSWMLARVMLYQTRSLPGFGRKDSRVRQTPKRKMRTDERQLMLKRPGYELNAS